MREERRERRQWIEDRVEIGARERDRSERDDRAERDRGERGERRERREREE